MSIAHEPSGLLTRSNKDILQPPSARKGGNFANGITAGVFFTVMILVGTGNVWLALNFGFGIFLVAGEILRFDDSAIGLTAGFLAGLCASGVIGSFFGPEIGQVTALGLFAAVAPAIHLMDTEPGWGRGGRNFFAVCWAIVAITLFLAWFFDSYSLQLAG